MLSAFLVSQAPQVHRDFLRGYVGSKTVRTFIPDHQGRKSPDGQVMGYGGTGFYIKSPESGKTYVITNNHICEHSRNGKVQLRHQGDDKNVETKIIKTQFYPDLCLLGPIKKEISGLNLASSTRIGEIIALLGFPGGAELTLTMGEVISLNAKSHMPKFNITEKQCKAINKDAIFESVNLKDPMAILQAMMTTGIVSACGVPFESTRLAVMGFPGNSGSAAVNFYGNVVGIHYAMSGGGRLDDQYVVKIEQIREFLKGY